MRKLLVSLLVAAAGVVAVPGGSAAGGGFTLYGGGFGHGVGMSQYGALGLARDGWNYRDILTHFYTGTSVAHFDLPNSIRVGVAQGEKEFHVEARSGSVELHLDSTDGKLIGKIPSGEQWVIKTGKGRFDIFDSKGHKVASAGGPHDDLIATYAGSMVWIKEAGEGGGRSYDRGHVEFNIYGDNPRGRAIVVVSPQDYVDGIGEMPSEWPMNALEVQAVASRTYAFYHKAHDGTQQWCNCDVTDTTRYQVYLGAAKLKGPSGDRWAAAVKRTNGEVVLYNGDLIDAQFASSDGGYTEDVENVWGGPSLPYLRGVCDPGDYTSGNSLRTWKRRYTASAITSALRGATGDIGTVTSFEDAKRGVSGRIERVTVKGTSGRATISGSDLQFSLALPSTRVWIDQNLLVTGPIRAKYDKINCRPGLAASAERKVAGGTFQRFDKGNVYHSDAAGAHWVWGDVLDFFTADGGPGGDLGFPTSDVKTADDGGHSAQFQHGVISCSAAGNCHKT